MSRIPIALELYSVREDAAEDTAGTLEAVAKMGYEGVEFAGYYGHSAEDLRKVCDDLGLQIIGTHTGLDTLLGDQLPATIEYNQILGNKYLIVPGLPGERTSTTSAWLETAKIFNEIAEQVAEHGMQTGYHNHSAEFKKMDGEYPWDTFFGNTRKEVVMQLDTGNALHAEVDVAPFIERYPGRAQTVHLKEHSSTNSKALIGEGDVNWQEIFKLCESIGSTEWYIVEQESYAFSPLECVDICLKNLKKMGK